MKMKIKLTLLLFLVGFLPLQAQECTCVCSSLTNPLPEELTQFVATEQQCTDQCNLLMYASSQFIGGLCTCMGPPNPEDPSPPITSPSATACTMGCDAAGYDNAVCTPIPVELVFFRGDVSKQHTIALAWQTASELNNAGFEIERSADALHWQLLDFVKGFGTTIEVQNYKWQDDDPLPNINYYRLRQVDADGSFEYSEVISVGLDKQKITALLAWPNPAQDFLYFQLVGDEKYHGESIEIYDSFGKLVKTQVADRLHLRNNQGELDISTIPTGLYIIRIQVDGQFFNQKFMKAYK